MFEMISEDILLRYFKFQTTPFPKKGKTISFLMHYFNRQYNSNNILLSYPLHIVMKITDMCNLKCLHCSQKNKYRESSILYMEKWKEIIDIVSENNVASISVTGGEPFLHPNIMNIIKHIKSKQIGISLLTNGLLLDDGMIDFLSIVLNKKTDVIKISIDDIYDNYTRFRNGADFDILIQNICKLKKKNIPIQATMVVTDINFTHMIDVYLFCIEHKIDTIRFMPLFEHEMSDLKCAKDDELLLEFDKILSHYYACNDDIAIISDPLPLSYSLLTWLEETQPSIYKKLSIDKFVCPAGVVSCEIDENGFVYPCSYLNMEELVIGNILDEDFRDKWKNSVKWKSFRNRNPNNEVCLGCKQKSNCLGGCPASSFYKSGKFGTGDRNCFLINKGENK